MRQSVKESLPHIQSFEQTEGIQPPENHFLVDGDLTTGPDLPLCITERFKLVSSMYYRIDAGICMHRSRPFCKVKQPQADDERAGGNVPSVSYNVYTSTLPTPCTLQQYKHCVHLWKTA